jgi:hypothetical protein
MLAGCSDIPDCELCPQGRSVCDKCRNGFSFQNGSCRANPCPVTLCLYCSQNGTCLRSDRTQFVMAGQLVGLPCGITHCQSCIAGSVFCQLCSSGFELDATSEQCLAQPQTEQADNKFVWLIVIFVAAVALTSRHEDTQLWSSKPSGTMLEEKSKPSRTTRRQRDSRPRPRLHRNLSSKMEELKMPLVR